MAKLQCFVFHLSLLLSVIESDELLRLILIVSNGETTPSVSLKDSNFSVGQLTEYGMKQEIKNGLFIHQKYCDINSPLFLLDTEQHRNLIEVQSPPLEANLMSSEKFLSGLFTREDEHIKHSVPIYETEYLDMTDCVGRREIMSREELATWEVVTFWGQNQDKIYDLYSKVGYAGKGINMLQQLYKIKEYQDIYELPQEAALLDHEGILTKGHELFWSSRMYWSTSSIKALAG